MYSFIINGITGERIDISMHDIGSISPSEQIERLSEEVVEMRVEMRVELENGEVFVSRITEEMVHEWRLVFTEWHEMSLYEQIEHVGLSAEALEFYTQTAMDLAERHFNSPVDLQLDILFPAGRLFSVDGITINSLRFTATNDTGREAYIIIPVSETKMRFISISTQHNDFVPGFNYMLPGIGYKFYKAAK